MNMVADDIALASFDDTEMSLGVRLGEPATASHKTLLFNHVDFVLRYHHPASEPPASLRCRFVGFFACARSIAWPDPKRCKHSADCNFPAAEDNAGVELDPSAMGDGDTVSVTYTYRVTWREDTETR